MSLSQRDLPVLLVIQSSYSLLPCPVYFICLIPLNIQKTKIMASGPITSWQIDAETMETVRDFIFGGLQNHCRCDCSHEIKRHLLLGRKVMTNLDCILKSRDITLPTKFRLVKAMVFPVVMYGCHQGKLWRYCTTIFNRQMRQSAFLKCFLKERSF